MITVEKLCKSFGNNQILKELSLEINSGETFVILGQSGVGKSVFLKHLMGLLEADSGKIYIGGKELSRDKRGLLDLPIKMGMLFQAGALFDSMTIEDNILFYLREHPQEYPLSESELKAKVQESLQLVGLQGIEKKIPSELSGGMKKRVALARMIVYDPEVLLYDEPTSGLDPVTSMQIGNLIQAIQKKLKATSVVVSHDLPLSLRIADRIAIHHEGVFKHISTPDAFVKNEDPLVRSFIDNARLRMGEKL